MVHTAKLVGGVVTAVIVATVLVINVDTSSSPLLRLSASLPMSSLVATRAEDEVVRRTWTQAELIETFPEIQAYLKSIEAKTEDLDDYVPRELVIEMRPDLVRQNIGAEAAKGYVAMSLYSLKDMTGTWIFNESWTTNYLILVSLDGELQSMLPITCCDGTTHFDAIKPYDDKTFTIGGNYLNSEAGDTYMWDWQANTVTNVAKASADAHDIQWSHFGDDTFYTPTAWGFARYEASTSSKVEDFVLFDASDATDVNHAQLIDHDETVFVSDRTYNRVALYNRTSGVLEWTCGGGSSSTLDMYDTNGVKLSSEDSLFYGQHNAEYFGESEYYIFDNNYNSANSLENQGKSRAIIMNVDIEEKRATLAWEYEFPGFSFVFGDNDRLPTSNILTTWWPYEITKETGIYDANVLEVTHETKETAWSLQVLGQGCNYDMEGECYRGLYEGWKIYSAERYYVEPLVYNTECVDGTLTFDTHNTFKTNNAYPGTIVWVTHDEQITLADKSFEWVPYWRTTSVTLSSSSLTLSAAKTKLTVTNKVGQSTTIDVMCTLSGSST